MRGVTSWNWERKFSQPGLEQFPLQCDNLLLLHITCISTTYVYSIFWVLFECDPISRNFVNCGNFFRNCANRMEWESTASRAICMLQEHTGICSYSSSCVAVPSFQCVCASRFIFTIFISIFCVHFTLEFDFYLARDQLRPKSNLSCKIPS